MNRALETYRAMRQAALNFESNLPADCSVGIAIGLRQPMTLQRMAFVREDADLVFFEVADENGSPIEIYQHVSQLDVALVPLARKKPEEPRRKIGFN